MPESTQPDGTAAPRLFDVLRQTLRVRHGRLRTEQQYVNWVRRFLRFHPHRHPCAMGAVAVSTVCPQNQARHLAVFLWSITWLQTNNTACAVIHPLIKSTLASSKPITPDLTGHRYGEYNTMPNTRRKPADCWHCCQSVAFTSTNISLCRRSNCT